ncbi:MAG TPA: GNAT family N-acetyltransferase [Gemmatimonadaceae bacterium]|jgi:RimJ/RimL family protein N-acetyltransferase
MTVLETERLVVRHLTLDDAEFILRLVNEPSFIANIGDRGIRSLEQASNYLLDGPIKSYQRHGHGPYLTALKLSLVPIGICGLLKRDEFDDMDLGYALLPEFWAQGFAFEASTALLAFAHSSLGAERVLGLVSPHNHQSIGLLEKLGFSFTELRQIKPDAPPTALYLHVIPTLNA